MARNITAGIDIGTNQVKVVIAELKRGGDRNLPRIIGTGLSESRGLRHGYIVSAADTVRSLRSALSQAEKSAGVSVKKAYLSVGGVGLEEVRSRGEVMINRADAEVADIDVEKALWNAEESIAGKLINKKILHVIPIRFRVDGTEVHGKPQGLKGGKLEVDVLFIIAFEQHLSDLVAAVEEVGVEVEDVMAAPIAASLVTLTKAQKIAGCVLANIGGETVSLVVFENNVPISVKVFPIGSTDITNDIALGLKVSLEEAEQIKRGAITGSSYPKKKLEEIVRARLIDIFELIESHLKKIGKNGLLPAGIIMTGGGTGIATIEDIAKASLHLPSKVALLDTNEPRGIKDSSWAVSYGLCIWGFNSEEEGMSMRMVRKTGEGLWSWLKQFLP